MLHPGRILLYTGLLVTSVTGALFANRPPVDAGCPAVASPHPSMWDHDPVVPEEPETPAAGEIPSLIEQLEALDPAALFDYHGNDHALIQRLTVLRFHATADVQNAIDRHENDESRKALVEGLYGVLGFVKDPDSIPWLEAKLASNQRPAIYEHYLWHWHSEIGMTYGYSEGAESWPWLTGRDRWIDFFIDLYATEPSKERRREHMAVLLQFGDPTAKAFFLAERRAPPEPGIALLVETYFHQNGVAGDAATIAAAIDALSPDERNHGLLIGTAERLRHEAFVPFLLGGLGYSEFLPSAAENRDVLRNTTYAVDVVGPDGWRAWYAEHKGQTRQAWVEEALQAFEERLIQDPCGAKQVFAKAIYAWNDLAALPLVRDVLLRHEDFHSGIAGWINLTYTPFNRAQLAPIAEVVARHPERLEEWAQVLLRERGFLPPERPESWAQHVAYANMKI